ncbi:ATP-binding protein [Streptomyces zingiberis]|uniref:histidine kinase n=1 Tax=Streptomyces zingiberis TaxID=2053010 RepID=A0ABX1C6U6_9ACTN|nr:ATP-binding protein [Streptomyces zingiberis]NJQ02674.1 hypothetical protein [Streptomyces zingiberis]
MVRSPALLSASVSLLSRRRLVRAAALLLAAVAVTDPWAGGLSAGWALACHALTAGLLVALFERTLAMLRGAERDAHAAREEAARHDAEWRDFCARQDVRREETVRHLAEVRLPAALAGARVPAACPGESHPGTAQGHERVLATATAAVRAVREREESLRLVVVALARRVQASSHRIQEEMAALETHHSGHPDVLEAGMRGDHAAAQQARLAQSLAVLCDEWPGQRWQKPHALVDVVRAGASRITAYQRVRVCGDQEVAVAAEAVEPLVHVVAELLANATQCAPPTTQVEVAVRTVTRGAVVEIDDAGLGMDEYALEGAREVASGRRLLGFADLGEVPQTGLAVVGRYAERHRLGVDLLPSPYGGVRAVVLVPAVLLRALEPATVPASRRPAGEVAVPAGTVAASGGTGLPQRRSARHRAAVPPVSALTGLTGPAPVTGAAGATAEEQPASLSPERAGAWMGALFAGGRAPAGHRPEDAGVPDAGPDGRPNGTVPATPDADDGTRLAAGDPPERGQDGPAAGVPGGPDAEGGTGGPGLPEVTGTPGHTGTGTGTGTGRTYAPGGADLTSAAGTEYGGVPDGPDVPGPAGVVPTGPAPAGPAAVGPAAEGPAAEGPLLDGPPAPVTAQSPPDGPAGPTRTSGPSGPESPSGPDAPDAPSAAGPAVPRPAGRGRRGRPAAGPGPWRRVSALRAAAQVAPAAPAAPITLPPSPGPGGPGGGEEPAGDPAAEQAPRAAGARAPRTTAAPGTGSPRHAGRPATDDVTGGTA